MQFSKVREYPLPLKQAFAEIRNLLAEQTYTGYYVRWNIATADTKSGCIVASLPADIIGFLLEVTIQLEGTDQNTTITRIEFFSTGEIVSLGSNAIIRQFMDDIDARLGPEVLSANSRQTAQIESPKDTAIGIGFMLLVCAVIVWAIFTLYQCTYSAYISKLNAWNKDMMEHPEHYRPTRSLYFERQQY